MTSRKQGRRFFYSLLNFIGYKIRKEDYNIAKKMRKRRHGNSSIQVTLHN